MIKTLGRMALIAAGLLLSQVAVAAPNWSGLYVGANVGIGQSHGQFTDDCYFCATDAFDDWFAAGGVQAGFNGQSGAFVYGVEGDFDWTGLSRSGILGGDDSGFLREKFDLNWMASVRARAGIAVDNALLYVTAGPVFGSIDAPGIEYCCNGPLSPASVATGNTFSASGTRTGLIGGFGAEVALSGGWSVRGEYLRFDLGEDTAVYSGNCGTNICTVQNTLDGQLLRVGVNYHLGD